MQLYKNLIPQPMVDLRKSYIEDSSYESIPKCAIFIVLCYLWYYKQ